MALDKYRADIAKICEDKGMPFGELDEQAILDSYGIFLTPEQVVDKFAEEFDDDVYEEGLKGEFAIFVDTGKLKIDEIKIEWNKLLNEAIKAKDDRINSQRLNDLYFQALELGVDLLPDV